MDKYQKEIYNNDQEIINEKNIFNLFDSKDNSQGDFIKLVAGEFYEIKTVKTISENNDKEINMKFNCKVESDNLKVVLVDGDKNLQTVFEGNENGLKNVKLKKGENNIRIVSNDVKYVEINLDIDEI